MPLQIIPTADDTTMSESKKQSILLLPALSSDSESPTQSERISTQLSSEANTQRTPSVIKDRSDRYVVVVNPHPMLEILK